MSLHIVQNSTRVRPFSPVCVPAVALKISGLVLPAYGHIISQVLCFQDYSIFYDEKCREMVDHLLVQHKLTFQIIAPQ